MRAPSIIAVSIGLFSHGFGAMAQENFSGKLMNFSEARQEITLHHGALEALKLPAKSTVFRLEDFGLLKGIALGDSVSFEATGSGNDVRITRIEKSGEEHDDHHH